MKKLAVWVITTGKSCSEPCFPHCFEYCIVLWTRHLERLSYQSIISRNSTVVTHCRVMMMTASRNPKNIIVQLPTSFSHGLMYIFPYGSKLQPFMLKCGLLIKFKIICQCRICLKSIKNSRNEGFQEVRN